MIRMIYDRQKREELEELTLAPYALKSADSKGRIYPEAESQTRTAFERDRDRIIHTTAFRRLEYKKQVFVNYEGDHYRTRLTHTLEVAQLGRAMARGLGANVLLSEAICLAHDLGHAPFGHAGEHILNELMHGYGGFNHKSRPELLPTFSSKAFFPTNELSFPRSDQAMSLNFNGIHSIERPFSTLKNTFQGQKGGSKLYVRGFRFFQITGRSSKPA